jgi:hypothetical protein
MKFMEMKYIRCGPHNITKQVHDGFYLEKEVVIFFVIYIIVAC